MKTVCLWSGGKDSCFAAYKALSKGHDIAAFINFTDSDGFNSVSHGISADVIRRQATMTKVPFIQAAMPKDGYRDAFKAIIEKCKKELSIEGIVFGDIYLQEHRDWIDSVCAELKVAAILPLWEVSTASLIDEFISARFKAVIVAIRSDILDESWLGREIDRKFVDEAKARGDIDLCGEKGEFHTFVYDGPIFQKAVGFKLGNRTKRENRQFLELK